MKLNVSEPPLFTTDMPFTLPTVASRATSLLVNDMSAKPVVMKARAFLEKESLLAFGSLTVKVVELLRMLRFAKPPYKVLASSSARDTDYCHDAICMSLPTQALL